MLYMMGYIYMMGDTYIYYYIILYYIGIHQDKDEEKSSLTAGNPNIPDLYSFL